MSLIDKICKIIGEKFCLNSNLSVEQAIELVLNRLDKQIGCAIWKKFLVNTFLFSNKKRYIKC